MSFYLLCDEAGYERAARELLPLVGRHGFQPKEPYRIGRWVLLLVDGPGGGLSITDPSHAGMTATLGPRLGGEGGHFTQLSVSSDGVTVACDDWGSHKIYSVDDGAAYTNSFLAALALCRRPTFDPLGIYAYAWSGGCFGARTFVREIAMLPAGTHLDVLPTGEATCHGATPVPAAEPADLSLYEAAQEALDPLRDLVGRLATASEGRVRLSFSGGFDSRLLLGTLLEQGVRPHLFVYGKPGEGDVTIAETVAAAEGVPLDRVDKGQAPKPEPDAFPDVLERSLVLFDGWKNDGLIDGGADAEDRFSRHRDGFWPVNGGLGEIYRNFFNLRDRRYRARDVVDAFYRPYRRDWAGPRFDEAAYRRHMAQVMAEQLELGPDAVLSAQQAQLLYPLMRGRFWTAREAEINQRFGPMLFPFLDRACIAAAARIPLGHKQLGRLQAEMIRQVCPRLAALPTDYGFSFDRPPSVSYRISNALSVARPVRLRPYLARLRAPRHRNLPAVLSSPYLGRVIDPAFPCLKGYFTIGAVTDTATVNRLATLEYLGERFGIQAD